ncbi:dihydrofolate reductase family protein [Mycetocola zhadangensis]|uniref:Reductase n=1 Tax=Mycetocola zhadangensis TaxID=1164595 RepID=A0A3L7J5Y3_9MICO|nr:dihydrofolate reductase family protein [Mycetocola zhadangensis]RLQ83942.1 reductase [Mycetocola zhadangensis]GGE97521.1 dihydrofolate reductase [Mycetocola zhadangensis]
MGKIIVQQLVTIDGFAADAEGDISFFESVSDWTQSDADQLTFLDSLSLMALGRKTYRMFAGYWPTEQSSAEIIADKVNALDKVVFSRSLDRAPWGDYPAGRVVAGDAAQTLRALADDAPGDVVVWGSLTLTDQLFQSGGVDEVRWRVCPMALGGGRRALPVGYSTGAMRLLRSKTYDSGLLTADYALL